MDVRVKVRNVGLQHGKPLSAQLLERRLHVQGVPQYDHINHQPERTELIWENVNPYGRFDLDMETRIALN